MKYELKLDLSPEKDLRGEKEIAGRLGISSWTLWKYISKYKGTEYELPIVFQYTGCGKQRRRTMWVPNDLLVLAWMKIRMKEEQSRAKYLKEKRKREEGKK